MGFADLAKWNVSVPTVTVLFVGTATCSLAVFFA